MTIRKKLRPDPQEYPAGNVVGLGRAAVTLILMKTAIDLPLNAPKCSGGFANDSFHSVFHTRRIYWSR